MEPDEPSEPKEPMPLKTRLATFLEEVFQRGCFKMGDNDFPAVMGNQPIGICTTICERRYSCIPRKEIMYQIFTGIEWDTHKKEDHW